jgi:hypothetical protein
MREPILKEITVRIAQLKPLKRRMKINTLAMRNE